MTAGTVAALMAFALTACGGSGGSGGSGGHTDAARPGGRASASATGATNPTAVPSPPPPPPQTPTTAPPPPGGLPSVVAADGTTIVVGDPAAKHTVTIEEDPRCPICKRFEDANDAQLLALAKAGTVQLRYVLASFIDSTAGGDGSHRAVNALRAAVQENRFPAYHHVLYANQPPESADGFTTAALLSLAGQVPGLSTPAFKAAVTTDRYLAFVHRSEAAFLAGGATGTPTVKIDGTTVTGSDANSLFTASAFASLLARHGIH
ncbi:thioredoxin domain-containing protein [Streptomyces sp. HPF1205]|uniref:DsbA family protein n=1 Tax=Streptomyces sp. HPF1205 TaxID=2873262 RepID=UPI001CECCFCF|nr:thioredoxin domain-containing protein [Streptomyces sp. HPF1205]